jgi:hypothetical protein
MSEEPTIEEGENPEPEGLPEGGPGEETGGETITITISVDGGGGDETGQDPVDDEDGDDPVAEPEQEDPIFERE